MHLHKISFPSAMLSVGLAIFFYFLILLCYRIMGRRELGQLSLSDFVMNLVIADIAATGIVEEEFSLDSFLGLLVLVALQIIIAKIQIKFPKTRDKMESAPLMFIKDGEINYEMLKRTNIQLDEVMLLLRQERITDISSISCAILEPNGNFSVFTKEENLPIFPLPLIISGEIKEYALDSLGKERVWLENLLQSLPYNTMSEIKYFFYNKEKNEAIIYTLKNVEKFSLK